MNQESLEEGIILISSINCTLSREENVLELWEALLTNFFICACPTCEATRETCRLRGRIRKIGVAPIPEPFTTRHW